MMVRVVYKNGIHDTVVPEYLDYLLAVDKIKMFRRSAGWVYVGIDAVRATRCDNYGGPERRGSYSMISRPGVDGVDN